MSDKTAKVIVLGKTQFNGEWLRTVTLTEALNHYKDTSIHADRVRNAWKRANGKK